MKIKDVLACAFDAWYSIFSEHTTKSVVLDLEDDILDYIKNAPLVLPKNSLPIRVQKDELFDDSDDSWSSEDTDEGYEATCFPEFEAKVDQVIKSLDGEVFPKLNWSAPKDAAWINFGCTLKCTSATDILVLLKASDFILHDIYTPFALCSDVEDHKPDYNLKLILRAWRNFRPESEFRCFVRSKKLFAICQRNIDSYFGFAEIERVNIIRVVSDFFENVVKVKFPLDTFVMDVYVGQNFDARKCVRLIDFNVFGLPTDGLMFDWDELESLPLGKETIYRWQQDKSMRSGILSAYKLPIDLVDISSGKDTQKLLDLVQAHVDDQKRPKPDHK